MDKSQSHDEYDDERPDSDGESFADDDEDENGRSQNIKDEVVQSPQSGASTGISSKHPTGSSKSPSHLQKRRRVTRACDECRRKKIKCDGKQPCTHCTVYSYDCTYDQPSNRRRNPAPQYVENLEHRVHRAETLLRILLPNLDLNDPSIEATVAKQWVLGKPNASQVTTNQEHQQQELQPKPVQPPAPTVSPPSLDPKADTNIESMLRAVAQLDMDEGGDWGYHGHSSGLSFVRRMREQLGDLLGPDSSSPFLKVRSFPDLLDSPKSVAESPTVLPSDQSSPTLYLPPKSFARETCVHALQDAAALIRLVHEPSFWTSFEQLYSVPHEQYTNEDHKFLPLFFSAMALGCLFRNNEETKSDTPMYEAAIQQGIIYFRTARQLLDIADCRSLSAIQATLFMLLFLQSSAKLSQCYAYIGVSLRAALRMGLHRSHGNRFNPIESEVRKRVFWAVRKMDIYVGAFLGLPLTLGDDDIDQDFPSEVDDEYITKDGILPMPDGQVSLISGFNAHTRLAQILAKIVRCIYPIKVQTSKDKSYSVPFSVIRELESDLENWKNSLPSVLQPCPAPERYIRSQQLLRLSYAHAQIMLYRPFLHFVAMEKRSKPMDPRSYACAASYVTVARNIIHIQTQMKQKGLLNGGFWFSQYISFFSILSLVYFAAENPDNAATEAVMKEAIEGKEVLAALAVRSLAADRCTATLNIIFQQLPDWMRNGQQNPITTRKRHLNSTPDLPHVNNQVKRNSIDIRSEQRASHSQATSRRSSTFPVASIAAQTPNSPLKAQDIWSHSSTPSVEPGLPVTDNVGAPAYTSSPHANIGYTGYTQQYMIPPTNHINNPALADFSVMFPTPDDPFNYPNQPLTTYESQKQQFNNPNFMSTPQINQQIFHNNLDTPMRTVPNPAVERMEEGMEAQFFPLPPYMDPQQQMGRISHAPSGVSGVSHGNLSQFSSGPATPMDPTTGVAGWQTQAGIPQQFADIGPTGEFSNRINIQELFGGNEWNPMLPNGYQMQ